MRRNIEASQGVTTTVDVVVRDQDGAVVSLSGLTGPAISWKAARDWGEDGVLTYQIGDGITVTDAAAGELTLTLDGDDLQDLNSIHYVHLMKVSKSGIVYRPLFGSLVVGKDIGT